MPAAPSSALLLPPPNGQYQGALLSELELEVDVATFIVSLFTAYWFLRLRCRGIGFPFGRRARPWALVIVIGTAVVSSGAGLLIVTVSDHVHTAYAGIAVPLGLWFPRIPPQDLTPRTLGAWLALTGRRG